MQELLSANAKTVIWKDALVQTKPTFSNTNCTTAN